MRGFLKNHLDPRAATRLHSVGALVGTDTIYSPMSGMSSMMNATIGKRVGGRLGIDQSETMFSGGFMSYTRAASQMDALESRIARRTAAGKPVDRLTRRLTRAQQSVTDISSITRPGTNVFSTFETTLEDLRKAQVGRRTTPLFQAAGGRAPGQYATYGGGPGVSNVRGKKGFQRMYRKPEQTYFERSALRGTLGEIDELEQAVARTKNPKTKAKLQRKLDSARGRASGLAGDLPGNTRVNIIKGPNGGYKAVLPSGESRFINAEIGKSLTAIDTGYRGNVLVSSASGQVTQRMLGYMRGAQGYGRAGGLAGQALIGAQNAVGDAVKMMSNLEAKGVGVRRAEFSVNTARQNLMANNGSVFASIDDVIKMQAELASSGRKRWQNFDIKSI